MDYCSGQLLYGNNQFVCVEDLDLKREIKQKITSNGGGDKGKEQSVYESSWSMRMGNAQRTGQGLGKQWDCYPLNSTEALVWVDEVSVLPNMIVTNSTPNSVLYILSNSTSELSYLDRVSASDGSLENNTSLTSSIIYSISLSPSHSNIITLSPSNVCAVDLWCITLEPTCWSGGTLFAGLNVGIDGTIYVYGSDGTCAFSGSGQLLWTTSLTMPDTITGDQFMAISQDGKTLFVLGFSGLLLSKVYCYAFDSQTGTQLFSQYVDEFYIAAVAVGPSGLVYVYNSDNYDSIVYALDAIDGALMWTYQNPSCMLRNLAYNSWERRYNFLWANHGVCAIDGVTGALKWFSEEISYRSRHYFRREVSHLAIHWFIHL